MFGIETRRQLNKNIVISSSHDCAVQSLCARRWQWQSHRQRQRHPKTYMQYGPTMILFAVFIQLSDKRYSI